MDAQKVGRRIQEARKARGLTQAELAQMVDLSTKYISNVECGFKTPKLNTLMVTLVLFTFTDFAMVYFMPLVAQWTVTEAAIERDAGITHTF